MCITIPCNYTRRLHINCPQTITVLFKNLSLSLSVFLVPPLNRPTAKAAVCSPYIHTEDCAYCSTTSFSLALGFCYCYNHFTSFTTRRRPWTDWHPHVKGAASSCMPRAAHSIRLSITCLVLSLSLSLYCWQAEIQIRSHTSTYYAPFISSTSLAQCSVVQYYYQCTDDAPF